MNRYVCIHGHFYQPPRENAWLEEIETQDSASPFHDWNERITAECYAPNAASRILDSQERICDIVNNYSKISFNLGPTLLSWMELHAREVYDAIIEADRLSRRNFSGHGSAIAQVYNHAIMPLADRRDKQTQVVWGIQDFEYRFGRKPEGMWLAETAVDIETLEALARNGIAFTILAPHQAVRARKVSKRRGNTSLPLDTRQAYRCRLPSGRAINLFFYDGAISRDVAFGKLLSSGLDFANRLCGAFARDTRKPQLVHLATDGETYGHHHKFGDMALAYCLHHIESSRQANLTVYGEFLERFPPAHEVEIVENTSWSCAHGVERWRADCGCNMGREGWNQKWRAPLREALNWLRDALREVYEQGMRPFASDPWKARDRYIDCILDRRRENIERFFTRAMSRQLTEEEKSSALLLLEMQRHAQLMFTSCGWFFDEISGIETAQILQYAARAIELTERASGVSLEKTFIEKLRSAPSNLPRFGNGAGVYEKTIRPSMIDLPRVAAHYAVSSLFEDYREVEEIFSYTVRAESCERAEAGRQRLSTGRILLRSIVTREESCLSFASLHLGDHNLVAGVSSMTEEDFDAMRKALKTAFDRSDTSEAIRLLERHFEKHSYSLGHLFTDERRRVLGLIIRPSLEEIERSFHRLCESCSPVMRMMKEMKAPVPAPLLAAAEFAVNADLRKAVTDADARRIESLIEEAREWSIEIDSATLESAVNRKLDSLMNEFLLSPHNASPLAAAERMLKAVASLPLKAEVWRAQNVLFATSRRLIAKMRRKDAASKEWVERVETLADYLRVKVD
jgi:alpha-amylase/alpha-mannosidase (GH57 family)